MQFWKKHKRVVWIAAVVAVALGVALFFALRSRTGGANAVYVQSVAEITGDGLTLVERFSGVTESQKTEKIAADASKTIKTIHVKAGDNVKKGDKLFSYDTELISLDVQQAQLEIESLQSSVATANNQISQYQRERQNASSSDRLAYDAQIQQLQAEINSTNYDIKTKQAELNRLRSSLQNADVTAPSDGTVEAVGTADEPLDGEGTMVTLRNGGELRVKGSVSEQNIAALSVGQDVVVRSRVDVTKTWTGRIESIDTGSAQQSSDEYSYDGGSGNRASFYAFYVQLDYADDIIMGQHVTIEPDYGQTEVREGLWLPAGYLTLVDTEETEGEDGEPEEIGLRAYVWADNGHGRLEKRTVTLGSYDDAFDEYEILAGLTTEDLIAWPDENCVPGAFTTTELVWNEDEEFGSFEEFYDEGFDDYGAFDEGEGMTDPEGFGATLPEGESDAMPADYVDPEE